MIRSDMLSFEGRAGLELGKDMNGFDINGFEMNRFEDTGNFTGEIEELEDGSDSSKVASYISKYEVGEVYEDKNVKVGSKLSCYLEVLKYERVNLERDVEIELLRKYQEDKDIFAKDRVIKNNLAFVVYMCKPYFSSDIDPYEVVSEGNKALMMCLDAFDCDSGLSFRTYLGKAIVFAIRRMKSLNSGYELSLEDRRLIYNINKINDEHGRELDADELKEALGEKLFNGIPVTANKIKRVLEAKMTLSLNKVIDSESGEGMTLEDTLECFRASNDFSNVEYRCLMEDVLSELTEKERSLIYRYFYADIPMDEISKSLGLSRQAVYHRKDKILRKLRGICIRKGIMEVC